MRPALSFSAALAVGLSLCFATPPARAKSKWKSKGQITLEGRAFAPDNDSRTVDQGLGLLGRLEVSHKHKPFQEKVRVFGRLDGRDSNRTVLIAEELWAEVKFGDFRLRVGADIINWTATEAFHPADIINARNLDSDSESYEKLGEPMVRLSYKLGSGTVSAYFFPYYTRTIFPAQSSRLSFIPPGIEVGPFLRMRADGQLTESNFGPQGAFRITQSFRGVDIGLHVIHIMDRLQPEVIFDPVLGAPRPLFRTLTQIGGTYQHVLGAFILKFEGGYRIFAVPDREVTPLGPVQDRDHLQLALGLEYGFIVDGAEVTVLAEAQSIFIGDEIRDFVRGDDVDTATFDEIRRNLGVFQRDAMAGVRVAFNDVNSSQLLVLGIIDIDDPEQVLVNASYSQRIGNSWAINAGLRLVFGPENPPLNQGFSIPPKSDHVRLHITRYF